MDYEINENRVLNEMIEEMITEIKKLESTMRELKADIKECLDKDLMIGLNAKSEEYLDVAHKKAVMHQRIDLLRKMKS